MTRDVMDQKIIKVNGNLRDRRNAREAKKHFAKLFKPQ